MRSADTTEFHRELARFVFLIKGIRSIMYNNTLLLNIARERNTRRNIFIGFNAAHVQVILYAHFAICEPSHISHSSSSVHSTVTHKELFQEILLTTLPIYQ